MGQSMRKGLLLLILLCLSGCAEYDNYHEIIRYPAPASMTGYWQTMGPQDVLVSPEAVASLIITEHGDILDCRQWVRVIAVPGKLTRFSSESDWYNVTSKHDVYPLSLNKGKLEYDGMMLSRVPQPTNICREALQNMMHSDGSGQ